MLPMTNMSSIRGWVNSDPKLAAKAERLQRYKNFSIFNITIIREFLGPSPSAFSGKKSRIIAGDVTVGTKKL